MTLRKYLHITALIGIAATMPVLAWAQAAPAGAATIAASASAEMTDAEVRKVDKENQKITLKHSEIKNLDMPPMTMVFRVSDPSFLDKVKAGDKVRFKASNDDGKLTVTEIKPVK